ASNGGPDRDPERLGQGRRDDEDHGGLHRCHWGVAAVASWLWDRADAVVNVRRAAPGFLSSASSISDSHSHTFVTDPAVKTLRELRGGQPPVQQSPKERGSDV